MPLDFPYHIDRTGRTALAGEDAHVGNMIRQVLFTAPGERVNRPDFGCALGQLAFLPNSDPLVAATRFLALSSLERWLGDLIRVEDLAIEHDGARLVIDVSYTRLDTRETHQARFHGPEGVVL